MILHIDTELMEKYDLEIRELWVLTALDVLTCRKPWTGTYEQLAEKSMCGSKASISRAMEVLKAKGLVLETEEGLVTSFQNETEPFQNETNSFQNETNSFQNETNLKSKRKEAKEKEKKRFNNNFNVCINAHEETHTTASPDLIEELFFMNTTTIGNMLQKTDGSTGYYKIIALEFGYLPPKPFIDDMYLHYNAHGWPTNGNKHELMRYWMKRYTTRKNARHPNLNEQERIILSTLVNHIEERLITRLLTILREFEVTDKDIRIGVDSNVRDKFIEWLVAIDAPKILEAYHRDIKVRGCSN